jgi:hypothetical protein
MRFQMIEMSTSHTYNGCIIHDYCQRLGWWTNQIRLRSFNLTCLKLSTISSINLVPVHSQDEAAQWSSKKFQLWSISLPCNTSNMHAMFKCKNSSVQEHKYEVSNSTYLLPVSLQCETQQHDSAWHAACCCEWWQLKHHHRNTVACLTKL